MSYSPQWEESKRQAKEYPMEQLLQHLNIKFNQYGQVYCPFHLDDNASASIGKSNMLKCFSSGCTASRPMDTISVYQQVTGADLRTAVNSINVLQNVHIVPTKNIQVAKQKKDSTSNPIENYRKFLAYFKPLYTLKKTDLEIVFNFFRSRRLEEALPILEKHKIQVGLDGYKNICFNFTKAKFGIVRGQNKFNMGSPTPIALRVNNWPIWFITEGLTDALTACVLGFNAMCLNSTSNTDMLIELIKKDPKGLNRRYIICTDADNSGRAAADKLEGFFKSNNYNYTTSKLLEINKVKDLNELYCLGEDIYDNPTRDYKKLRKGIDKGKDSTYTFGNSNWIETTSELTSYLGYKSYIPQLRDYSGEINCYKITP